MFFVTILAHFCISNKKKLQIRNQTRQMSALKIMLQRTEVIYRYVSVNDKQDIFCISTEKNESMSNIF